MPKIVDHEERRQQIVEAVWRVIARGGIAQATTREIAREANCSVGVLAHYFADKTEIMTSAVQAAHEVVRDQIRSSSLTGLPALREYMLECLPLDESRRLLAAIEVSFWGQAIGNSAMIEANQTEIEGFHARTLGFLTQALAAGELRPGVDLVVLSLELRALMDGISAQSVMLSTPMPAEQQIQLIDAAIDRARTTDS